MTNLKKILSLSKRPYVILISLFVVFLTLFLAYIYQNLGRRPDIVLPMRLDTAISVAVISVSVGVSTILFQTVTNSRILSPGILGIENSYLFVQTAIVFLFGSGSYLVSTVPNFLISVGIMVALSLLIFAPLILKNTKGIFFVLLIGVVIGQLMSAFTTYIQLLINPDEFSYVQGKMFASFEYPNMYLTLISFVLIGLCLVALPRFKKLDVMSLGRENAIGLGVNFKAMCIRSLIIVSVLVSVSTVMVGPMMFLGVLVANLTYVVFKTHKHIYLIPGSVILTGVLIMATQYFRTHVYNFGITISVLINFVGGVFFLFVLLKERKKSN